MSNTILPVQPFAFEGHDVRVLDIDGEPWFVASDVAKILGYESSYYLTRGLDDDEKGAHIVGTPGGDQEMTIISESGLYSAILRSRVEGAKAFKRWITREVIPAIRKTGSYGTNPAKELTRADLASMVLEAERELSVVSAALESAAPAIAYHDRYIVDDGDVMTVTNFAAPYGMSASQMYDLMNSRGLLKKIPFERWSEKRERTVAEHEWRFRSGKTHPYAKWFDLRPQHNAPRHMNGQVRQTIYVRSIWAPELAAYLGLDAHAHATPATQEASDD